MKQRHIMHLDGDAFFVSVEAAMDPSLRGRPVVTGEERGIASALSYEAKKLGITRAMPIFRIHREFPQVIVVRSSYRSYAVFSRRMMDIVRRYTGAVEEYSIDECFADMTQAVEAGRDPERLLGEIQYAIQKELGISVSLGLGPTKVLAKTASKSCKPRGLVVLGPAEREPLLDATPVDRVWGFGPATARALRKQGVATALEFARKPLSWVEERFSKPAVEMWYELNGYSVRPVEPDTALQKSIMKTRTFGPASRDRSYVFSELSKNIENACSKVRGLGLTATGMSIYLKTKDFSYLSEGCVLPAPSNDPFELIREAEKLFARIFDPSRLYRATGVTLGGLVSESSGQADLFGAMEGRGEQGRVLAAVDRLNRKYGKNVVRIASSQRAFAREERGEGSSSARDRLSRLNLPFLGPVR